MIVAANARLAGVRRTGTLVISAAGVTGVREAIAHAVLVGAADVGIRAANATADEASIGWTAVAIGIAMP